jgi:hypothetical protein
VFHPRLVSAHLVFVSAAQGSSCSRGWFCACFSSVLLIPAPPAPGVSQRFPARLARQKCATGCCSAPVQFSPVLVCFRSAAGVSIGHQQRLDFSRLARWTLVSRSSIFSRVGFISSLLFLVSSVLTAGMEVPTSSRLTFQFCGSIVLDFSLLCANNFVGGSQFCSLAAEFKA